MELEGSYDATNRLLEPEDLGCELQIDQMLLNPITDDSDSNQFSFAVRDIHFLTRKDVQFEWTAACQDSFNCLKNKLIEGPVLAYPDFRKDYVLETDTSKQGLGAILSQVHNDGKCHPVS